MIKLNKQLIGLRDRYCYIPRVYYPMLDAMEVTVQEVRTILISHLVWISKIIW